ncbi:GNAT family N-acetyltransferase [Candidatus Woesearchaeota archaeon]|nr:GNAT family N-acetyltransferase [Candidatus Woesearchaeota archaeon]
MKISIAKTKEELLQAFFIRREVLIEEKKYSIYKDEPDKDDLVSDIYIAKDKSKVVGTARIRKERMAYRIQRMAIVKHAKGKGIGSKIMKKILQDQKNKKISLISPKETIPFYEKFGFKKTDIIQKGKYHKYYRLQNY